MAGTWRRGTSTSYVGIHKRVVQHVTGRSSAYHLRDLRCSPPLLDRLYRPIALHFDTLHVRRRPLLVQKRHISCRPVSCLHCSRSSIGIRPAFTGAFASRILWAGRIHLLSPGTVVVFVAQHDGRASEHRSWAHPVFMPSFTSSCLEIYYMLCWP